MIPSINKVLKNWVNSFKYLIHFLDLKEDFEWGLGTENFNSISPLGQDMVAVRINVSCSEFKFQ